MNVIARICPGRRPSSSTDRAKRSTSTDVLPLPAPAASSSGALAPGDGLRLLRREGPHASLAADHRVGAAAAVRAGRRARLQAAGAQLGDGAEHLGHDLVHQRVHRLGVAAVARHDVEAGVGVPQQRAARAQVARPERLVQAAGGLEVEQLADGEEVEGDLPLALGDPVRSVGRRAALVVVDERVAAVGCRRRCGRCGRRRRRRRTAAAGRARRSPRRRRPRSGPARASCPRARRARRSAAGRPRGAARARGRAVGRSTAGCARRDPRAPPRRPRGPPGSRSGLRTVLPFSCTRRRNARSSAAWAAAPRSSVSSSGSRVCQPQPPVDEPLHRAARPRLDVADGPRRPPPDRREHLRMAQRRGRRLAMARDPPPPRRAGARAPTAHAASRPARGRGAGDGPTGRAEQRRDVVDEQRAHRRLAVVACVVPRQDETLLRARHRHVEQEALGVERLLVAAQHEAGRGRELTALGVAEERLGPRRPREAVLLHAAQHERADASRAQRQRLADGDGARARLVAQPDVELLEQPGELRRLGRQRGDVGQVGERPASGREDAGVGRLRAVEDRRAGARRARRSARRARPRAPP